MNRHLRSVLLVLSLCFTQAFVAQKLYWVGGSGNFNDPNHWSQQSGGIGGAKTPTATDNVYFDEHSFLDKSIINFIGASEVHDFIFTKYTPAIIFSGLQNEKITINGNVQLNSYIDNQFAGDVWLASNQASTSVIFDLVKFKGNLYFNGNTNWQLQSDVVTDDNSSLYFKKGVFNLNHAVIYSGNLIADPQITINSNQSNYRISNKFVLPAGVIFNDTKSHIYAHIKDATKFQIAPSINFNSSTRLHGINSVMSACNITLTSQSQPTCLGSCNGTLVFNIPASCSSSSNPIYAVWTSGSGCTNVPTATLTPGSTYTVSGLCGCTQRYTPIFTNDPVQQDSSYSPSTSGGIAIGDPSPPLIQNLNALSFPPSCFGSCNGSIIMTIGLNSGTQPLTSTWTQPVGTPTVGHANLHNGVGNNKDTLKNVCAGTYTVFITDKNGCTSATSTVTMLQPPLVTHNITPTNILCFGVCNGSANEVMSGGTSPFTFTWTTAGTTTSTATSSTNSNLCAGTYTVRTKDAHQCKDSATITITQPPDITFTKNPLSGTLNIPCLNACSGNVGVTNVNGGTGAYTFSWSPAGGAAINGNNSSVYTGLCGSVAGLTYTCTIKDSNNCVKTTNFTVKAPPALSHTITGTNPKCNAGATGSATVTESGGAGIGAPAYTFSWSPSGGTVSGASPKSIYSNISGGTYTVVATDFNNCTDTATVTLTLPPVLTATISTIINPTCPNLNNGQLCVTPGGGTPTYTFTWNPAAAGTASCTPASLVSGTYTVTIKDANSCTVTTSATLVPPPSITVTAAVTQPSCAGLSNGSATLTATGGNGVFSYHWSCSPSITNTISGQSGGTTCNYTVTDGNNCKQTGSVTFTFPSPLTLTLTPTTLACNGNCNAQITSGVGGGTFGYTFAWSGSNSVCGACANQTNMCAGTYTCTVTDANGCTKTANTTIAAPTPITVTFTPVNPTCNGSCDGSILAVPSGGTGAPYTISWTPALPAPNAPNTLNPINLCANTYSLQITDANLCTVQDTVSIIDPLPVTIVLTTNSITCAGQNNGTATVTPSGGTPAYTYTWLPTGGNGATASNLSSGSHTVIVKDNKGCSTMQTFIINQPTNLTANPINIVNTCNGLCNGGATASVAGGTPGYQYCWDAPPFSPGATSVNALCVGTHTLFVKDTNNCITSANFNITPIININISSSSTSVSCHNLCDATATGSALGGAPPYTIQWTGPSSSNTCNNVPAGSPCIGINLCGTSTITATDANGCSNTATVSIANPPALTATTNTTSVECFGLCTGTATVTPSGGTPAGSAPLYSIAWTPGPLPNGTTESNLCPGTYTATITDNNGCQLAQPVIIGVSNQFTVNPTITSPSTCGASDASINLAISGGSGTYTVNWNTGSTANPLTNIPAGTYTATINDANGCDTVIVYGVNNLTGPTTTVTVNNNVTCPGQNNGSATVSGSGNGAITVTWPVPNPAGPSPQTGANLSGGITLVQVKDVTGCITTATVTITAPSPISDGPTVIQPTCGGGLGSILLNPSGGTGPPPYSYNWNGVGFVVGNNSLTNLSAGTYSCVIQDALGCISQTFTYVINSTSTLSLTVNTTSVTCSYSSNGTANANASGSANPPYTYTWTSSSNVVIAQGTNISNVSALAPGVYSVSVNDASSCNIQTTFTISAPLVLNPNFIKSNNLCSFGNTGSATVTPTGGTQPSTYLWNTSNPNPTTQSVDSIIPGSYHVIVYDANFCSDTTYFTITAPSPLTMTVASTNPTCFGLANGSATITAVAGGTPFTANGTLPYTLSWNGISCPTCSVVTNLSGGTLYTAIAADSNGCSVSQTFTLTPPPQISPTFTLNSPTCVGYSDGSILSNTTGGTGPGSYSYTWTPLVAGNVPNAINLSAGNYELIIADGNNCKDTNNLTITPPPSLALFYSSTPATCNQSNGSIIINSANGTGTVSVQWVNPPLCASSFTCNALPAGIYSIKITDSNGCTDTLPAFVTNSGGPVINTTTSDINCYGTCNGVVSATVTAGIAPFTFTWNSPPTPGSVVNTATTSIASSLCDSSYILTVADSAGCKTITSFNITQPSQIQDNPNISSATCFGINNGSITSNASGGTPFANGYQYSIDGGATFGPSISHTFSNLSAGTHVVSITDSVGCMRAFTYTIIPASIITSNISGTNGTCFGNCNGTATVLNIVGGNAPITIAWNDGQVGNFATNLCAGTYTATITDNAGCQAYDTISITSPSAINPNTVITNPTCGQCDGTITVAPTGGNGGVYTYTWTSPPSNAPSLNNICAGPYQVNIADNLDCTQTFQIPVSNSSAPTLTLTTTNVACNTRCSGSATVTASGGITPYTYSWPNVTPVSTSSVATSLCADTINPYFVQVKDSLGCIATQSFVITAPQTFTVNNTNTSPSCTVCNGVITLTVTGASTYTCQWSANAGNATTFSVTGLCAGIYSVVVTDIVSGCKQTKFIGLNNSSGPTLSVTPTNAACFGMCNGSATVTASFGTPGYTYTWTPSGGNGTTASNLCDSTYFILVTDAAGCLQTSQVNITSPTALVAGLPTVSPIKCANDCNGTINTVIFGGTPSYTYSWSPATISGTSGTNLCSGNYSLTVTDANGCSVQEFDTLVNPALLVTTGTVTPASCNNIADGMIKTSTSGGAPTYTYQWSGGSNAQIDSLNNVLAGTYTLVATDIKGCTDTTTYNLPSTITVIANAGRDTVLCSNAPIVLTATVTGTATFNWQDTTGAIIPPANTLTLTVNPTTTTHYILMAYNGACRDSDTVAIFITPAAVANAGANQSVFFGQAATIGGNPSNPIGGTITWMPNINLSDTAASNPVASPSVTTTYTLFVTNALGCISSDTMMVIVLPPFNINNGFTPNGDGKNDTWVIDELYKFPNTEIEIYNRWGEQLFYSKGAYTPWNGTYKGSPVPVGTYYYVIRLNDKNYPDHYAGPLTILR